MKASSARGVFKVPFDFEAELKAATWKKLNEIRQVPVVSLRTLVRLKRAANRDQDPIDLDNLPLRYPNEIDR